MRRLTLAALSAALVLTACSDRESPTEPGAPVPEETFGTSCQVVRFPLVTIVPLIRDVFPVGRLRLEAVARAGAIKLFWDTCHPAAARRIAVSFIEWMNGNVDANRLPGAEPEEVQALTIAILNGVGVEVEAPTAAGRIGAGIVAANATEETVIPTQDGCLLAAVPGGQPFESNSDQDRLLVIKGLPASFRLSNFPEGNQSEPFWDVDVTLLSGGTTPADKVLKADKKAVVAAVLLPGVVYPDGVRIGHNPPAGTGEPAFEILEQVQINPAEGEGEDRTDLAAELEDCTSPGENLGFGDFGGGLPGLAQAAWGSTARYLGPIVRSLLLPQPLSAAAMVTVSGPISGKTRTFSPFGVVEVADDAGVISNGTVSLGVNPQGQLNAPAGEDVVGLRFGGLDGIAHGCLCEGWGVAHEASAVSGYANQSQSPQAANLALESFARTATEATSVVRIGSTFRVRHHFRPIVTTANLYEVHVTVENISDQALSGVVYRRVVDWDVAPTPFAEFVTIVRAGSLTGFAATNNGFSSADPLVPVGPIGFGTPDLTANFFNAGPYDHGAVFDITLSTIYPGETNTFVIYYGAAANALAAKTALRSVGSSAISFARPSGSSDGTPNTFMIGFSGLPGSPLQLSEMEPPIILGAPPALRLMERAAEPHPRNRQ